MKSHGILENAFSYYYKKYAGNKPALLPDGDIKISTIAEILLDVVYYI